MPLLVVGRYELWTELASGGMATMYLGLLRGERGFARPVAIKRLHRHLASAPAFVAGLLDEARLAARIRHPNVASTLDVLEHQSEIFVVMDYVHGESLSKLRNKLALEGKRFAPSIIGAIVSGVLQGLHAAHEAKDEHGAPLCIVHRDVSPQNVLIGADGVPRVIDFGVAKAEGRLQSTDNGEIKGKTAYMAPEQLSGEGVDRRTDVFAASILLWELLTGQRLFQRDTAVETIATVLAGRVVPPRSIDPSISPSLEEIVMAGLDPVPERRFATAREMDEALTHCCPIASPFDVAEWLEAVAGDVLSQRTVLVKAMETSAVSGVSEPGEAVTEVAVPPLVERSRATRFGIVVAALACVIVFFFGIYLGTRRRVEPAVTSPLALVTVPPKDATPSALPSSSVAASSSPPEAPPLAGAARAPRPVGTRRPKAPASPSDCNPPYWVDGRGKHFKENCPL
jgi:serine/threonine-protein kinase